jgi:hypothetical protein
MSDEQVARSLEVALALAGALLAACTGVLLLGRALGGAARYLRYREEAPSQGSIPAERHQNVLTSSPR